MGIGNGVGGAGGMPDDEDVPVGAGNGVAVNDEEVVFGKFTTVIG